MRRRPASRPWVLGALAASTLAFAQASPARLPSAPMPEVDPTPVISAYVPDYRLDAFRAEQAEGLTDLILFSVRPDFEGHVRDPARLLDRLETLTPPHRQHRWRVLLSVGGGGNHRSDAFSEVAADAGLRANFVSELAELCTRYGLDGIDLDWEHLKDADDTRAFATLLTELKQALSARRLLLTVAVADPAVLLPEAVKAVDRIHLMAYDGPVHGSFALARERVEAALAQGIPPGKLCLGIPLYALGVDPGASASYGVLVARYHPDPSVDELGSLRFNGLETTRAKVRLLKEKRLGGAFFWELSQDASGEASLVKAVREELRATSPQPVR